jgi:hypothetical protein
MQRPADAKRDEVVTMVYLLFRAVIRCSGHFNLFASSLDSLPCSLPGPCENPLLSCTNGRVRVLLRPGSLIRDELCQGSGACPTSLDYYQYGEIQLRDKAELWGIFRGCRKRAGSIRMATVPLFPRSQA